MAQMSIFVSHSSHDNAWCRPFAQALKAVGYDVWYDETGLQGGAQWVDSIQREVENREVFLLVLTPEAWASQWVQDELQLAIATRRRILPVLLRNTQVSGFLLTTQWVTVIGEEPQAAARAAIMAIETPPAPGRNAAPQATNETLDDLKILCRSLATEGRYTEALSACGRALALDRNNIVVLRIKAWVLDKIGEYRLEGQTLFQILLLDPSDERLWSQAHGLPYKRIWDALDNEHDLLQAYSLLRAASHPQSLAYSLPQDLLRGLLGGLNRINCLDAAMDILARGDDDWTRMYICQDLQQMNRPDLVVRLMVEWHGCPPGLANQVAAIPLLDAYAQTLAEMGQSEDAMSARKAIVGIFEKAYNQYLRGPYPQNPPPWQSNQSDIYKMAYKSHLAALDALGRTPDADWLRKTYPLSNSEAQIG